MSPTQRSLQYCRSRGWHVCVVEKWNAFARIRVDAFGYGDLLAVDPRGRGAILVQTTSGSNLSARRHKATDAPATNADRARKAALIAWTTAGNQLLLHGWRKLVSGWAVKEEEIGLNELLSGGE